MYAVLAAVCCDDCTGGPGKGTPATECPPAPTPAITATVQIAVTATPKAWCPITSYTCSAATDYVCADGALIAAPHGTAPNPPCKTCALEFPEPTLGSGLTGAVMSVCWSSYTDTTITGSSPTETYTTTCVECGSDTVTPTAHTDTFEVTLACTENETFGVVGDVDGISGTAAATWCCDECECDATLLCSRITLVMNARWSETFDIPILSELLAPCGECIEGEVEKEYVSISKSGTTTVEIIMNQQVTMIFERTILNTQADERLALGAYTCVSVTAAAPTGAGLHYPANPFASTALDYFGTSGTCWNDAPAGETDTCSDSLALAYGWDVSVTVTA